MRLRIGLALLFAVVAFAPFAIAVEWQRETQDVILREAQEERADRIASLYGQQIDGELARLESAVAAACARGLTVGMVDPELGARMRESSSAPIPGWSVVAGSRDLARVMECAGRAVEVRASADAIAESANGASDARVIAIGAVAPAGPDGERRILRTFGAGQDAIQLALAIDPVTLAPQARERAQLRLQILALSSVVLAFVLGFLIGGRLQRPLGELERAAQRIGKGDLEVQIDRSGGSAGATFSAFNKMTRELKDAQSRAKRAERVAAWRDIARRIAHEIKNPLTPIRMSMETMRRTKQRQHPDFDEIFEESTKTVLEEVERLERIVTEFSRFARLPRPRPTALDVRDVIAQVVQLHDPGGDSTITDTSPRLPVKMILPGSLPKVRVDRDQLTQVLVNLVQNAIDAARSKNGEAGRVEVEVEESEDGVCVTISDDGPGIPEEDRARILEPYYTTKAGGTGLGLAIVDRIVSEHGGWLEISESRRGGAAISITLTREGPPEDAEASQTS